MPATRLLKRRAEQRAASVDPVPNHAFQLTFASPSSAPTDLPAQGSLALQTTISFAPNVTPVTFTAPPSDDVLLDAESTHNALFPDASDSALSNPPAAKRRRKTTTATASRATPIPSKAASKKSSKNLPSSKCPSPAPDSDCKSTDIPNSTETPAHIPRPPNAFILFRSSFIRSQHVSAETEGNHGTLSKIVGMLWHALSYEERQVWQAKARRAYAEHKRMYPGYSFRPSKDKSALNTSGATKPEREGTPASQSDALAPKRKTRTVGPRDIQRCEHIAALLARGLKGAELDAAMKNFDAARQPQTITPRFEAPLTAQTYAATQDKDAKEGRVKKEDDERDEMANGEDQNRERTVERTVDVQVPPSRTENQAPLPPPLAQMQPRRVRRSSSAPLLDVNAPISAPAPLYPTSTHAHLFHSQTPGPFEFGQQQRDGILEYGQDQQQSFAAPFGYSQGYPHSTVMQEGTALRKRSASSSPPLRRPSYSFSYMQGHPQAFGHHFSTPYTQQQEPQPLMHTYPAAHPHLQQVQAQVQAQSHVRMQSQPENQSAGMGLGLELDQSGQQPNYGASFARQQEGSGLSRQSTLTDMSSEDSATTTNANGSGYWNESVDFGNFSFSATGGHEAQTPISAHPSNPNPFDVPPLSAAPSNTTVDELDYNYADMPGLVEAPLYHNYYQPPSRAQHPHLEIQTSWTSEEFNFDQPPASAATVPPSSALEPDSVPPSAVSGAFDFPPSDGSLGLDGGYMGYATPSGSSSVPVQAPTPCSPASQSASGAPSSTGVRTPIDDAFHAWDRGSATASVSPVTTYDACSARSPEAESASNAHILALQAGFRTYLAHAEKTGALDNGASDATFDQFVRFVRVQQGIGMGVGSGLKGMSSAFGAEAQTQMANVM